MAVSRTNKKHYATPAEKAAQRRRTRNNKIYKLKQMLKQNPNNFQILQHLEKWERQVV